MERKHYDLEPFREAQQRDFPQALAEIRAGQNVATGFGTSSHSSVGWDTATTPCTTG